MVLIKYFIYFFVTLKRLKTTRLNLLKEKAVNFALLLRDGKWEAASNFVQWCFISEEEIILFYNKFFISKIFVELFEPEYMYRSTEAIFSFIKTNNLGRLLNNRKLIAEVCLKILSHCYILYYDINSSKLKTFLETMDRFLLSFFPNDSIILPDLKKELFNAKNREVFISFSLEFRKKEIERNRTRYYRRSRIKINEAWHQIMDDFFNWISVSDVKLKAEMEKEFWHSKEILEAEHSDEEYKN